MGQILSQPVTEKFSETGQDDRLYFGLSSMQGWRVSMEDSHAAILDLTSQGVKEGEPTSVEQRVSFFGVYDGHGGDRVALFTGDHLHNIVAKQAGFERKDYGQALKDGFLGTDRAILKEGPPDSSGCAATSVVVSNSHIICANAGDSRTILGVKGIAKPLSFDHKPQNEGEKSRICAAGGFVEMGRVNGNLALSRAIGDFDFKKSANLPPEEQVVTAFPDIIEHQITPDDEFIVLACDGIWDCMHSQQVVEFVRRGIAHKQPLEKICENLMDNCLAAESDMTGIGCDNMTVMIVALLNGRSKEEWYDFVASRVENGEGPVAPASLAEMKGNPFDRRGGEEEDDDSELANQASSPSSIEESLAFRRIMGQALSGNGPIVLQAGDASSLFASLGLPVSPRGATAASDANGTTVTNTQITELEDEEVEHPLNDDK